MEYATVCACCHFVETYVETWGQIDLLSQVKFISFLVITASLVLSLRSRVGVKAWVRYSPSTELECRSIDVFCRH